MVFAEECTSEAPASLPILGGAAEECEEIDEEEESEFGESTLPFLEVPCSLSLTLVEFRPPTDNLSELMFPCK